MFNLETTKGHNKIGNKSNNGAPQGAQARTGVTRELKNSSALTWTDGLPCEQTFLSWMSFNIYEVVRAACQSLLGTFRSNDATATGTSLHVLSVLNAIIPTYLLCQMYANPPELEFQVTMLEFRKRNIISSSPVYVLHKTRN